MGSVVAGRKLTISLKKGMGRLKRAIMKAPLLVFDKILVRSVGVVLSESSRSKSSEIISVKSSDLPIGMSDKAFLIQKINMAGQAERPINVQPMVSLKNNNAIPPKSRAMKMIRERAKTGGLFKMRF